VAALVTTQLAAGEPAQADRPQADQPRTVRSADGRLELTIPAGAVRGSPRIRIRKLARPGHATGIGSLALAGYELLPNGLRFSKPVTLTLRLPGRASLAGGLPVVFLALRSGARWSALGRSTASVVEGATVIRSSLRHFSTVVAYEGAEGAQIEVTPNAVEQNVGEGFTVRIDLVTKKPQAYRLDVEWSIPTFLRADREVVLTPRSRTRAFECVNSGSDQTMILSLRPQLLDRSIKAVPPRLSLNSIPWTAFVGTTCRGGLRISPIDASFDQETRSTRYSVAVDAPQPEHVLYLWQLTPPENDPACNNQGNMMRTTPVFVWLHGDDHGCNHLTAQGPRGHLGLIVVFVQDGRTRCRAEFHGTNSDVGPEPTCRPLG
jgi:hypothetical protein